MKEIWKDIKDYEGLYQISNFGNVRSVNHISYFKRKNYTMPMNFKGKELKKLIRNNYYYVDLSKIIEGNRVVKHKTIHRLVAETFIDNPLNKKQINHIDGNKLNNCVTNLEWVTQSENTIHAYKNGLIIHRAWKKEGTNV